MFLCLLPGEEGFRKRVAVKAVHPRHAKDSRFRELFIREARLAASLSHPNLIQVFDFGKEGDACFLVMEYVEGWDLGQVAAQARRFGLPIPPGIWWHWVEGMLSGLIYLHEKRILHRDVSPGNLLVGRTGAVKLSDFGVSRAAAIIDEAGDVLAGKAAYFSPERARREGATPASDLFAAAAVAAELLLGRRLFEGGDPADVLERIRSFDPDNLEFSGVAIETVRIVRKGLAPNPEDRFQDAGSFLAALAACGPERATSTQLAVFLESLFPGSEEEATAPALALERDTASSMSQALKRRYEFQKAMGKVSTAAAIAIAVWGIYLWIGRGEPDSPAVSPPVSSSASVVSTSVPTLQQLPTPPANPASEASANPAEKPVSLSISASVQPMKKYVWVKTDPEGADILFGNNELLDRTPARINLSEIRGKEIILSKDGYGRKRVSVSTLAKVDTFHAELEPTAGVVDAIQAIPWAQVYLGERFLGDTPLSNVRLPVGEHRLRFVNEPLGVDRVEKLLVRPGKNPKVIVQLMAENH